MARFCTNCGNKLSDNLKFCTKCGHKLEIDVPTTETPKTNPKEAVKDVCETVKPTVPVFENRSEAKSNIFNAKNLGLAGVFCLMLAGGGYMYSISTPQYVVESYLTAINKGQYEKAYEYLLMDDKFNSAAIYAASVKHLKDEAKFTPYSLYDYATREDFKLSIGEVKPLTKEEYIKKPLLKNFSEGHSVAFEFGHRIGVEKSVKRKLRVFEAGKKFLFFKNYKVYDDSIFTLVKFSGDKRTQIELNGKKLVIDTKKKSSYGESEFYPLVFGKHELHITNPLCLELKSDLLLLPQEGSMQIKPLPSLHFKNEIIAAAQKEGETFIKKEIEAAAYKRGLESTGYKPEGDPKLGETKYLPEVRIYKSFENFFNPGGASRVLSLEFKQVEFEPASNNLSDKVRVKMKVHFTYKRTDKQGLADGQAINGRFELDMDCKITEDGKFKAQPPWLGVKFYRE